MTQPNIEYVDYSLANNFGDTIELNKNLLKYPDLHNSILEHELGHTNVPGFTITDFNHDLKPQKVNQLHLLKFMVLHPKSFVQLLPIYHTKKRGWVYDINLSIIYLILIFLIVSGIVIGFIV